MHTYSSAATTRATTNTHFPVPGDVAGLGDGVDVADKGHVVALPYVVEISARIQL